MNRTYDLFERLSDGQFLWRCSASGPENVLEALNALAQETLNECFAMDLSTREVPERVKYESAQSPAEPGTGQAESLLGEMRRNTQAVSLTDGRGEALSAYAGRLYAAVAT